MAVKAGRLRNLGEAIRANERVPTWRRGVEQGQLAVSLPAVSCGRKSGHGNSLQYSWQFLPQRNRRESQSRRRHLLV